MKYTELLKKEGRKAIKLINKIKSERDELKDYKIKNIDVLNRLKDLVNNLPKPVAPIPIKQTELSTQTDPIPAPRHIKQTELSTQTDPIPAPRPIKQTELSTQTRPIKQTELSTQTNPTPDPIPMPTVQDDYVPIDLLEPITNEMGKILNIKDRLFLDYAAENPKLFTTANEIKFFTSFDFGLLEKLIKDFNVVLNDLKQDNNPNFEQDLNKLQEIQDKIINKNKSFEDTAYKVGLVRDNFDKKSDDETRSKLYDYMFGELWTKFKNLILLNNLFINSLKDKTKK